MRALAFVLVLLPAVARGGTFVTGNGTLPGPKVDAKACTNPDPNKCLAASDYNALREALFDLRTALDQHVTRMDGLDATVAPIQSLSPCQSGLYRSDATGKLVCETVPLAGPSQCTAYTADGWTARTIVTNPITPVTEQLLAFRGAEGSAATTTGGRGGVIYTVNTLADTLDATTTCVVNANGTTSGTCTLRNCLSGASANGASVGARTCTFTVGGTIEAVYHFYVSKPNLTVAGQTAPGGGIQISGKTISTSAAALVYVQTHDVVWRYTRLRKGWTSGMPDQKGSTVSIAKGSYGVVFDHNSIMWSQDENVTIWTDTPSFSLTFSWNLIAEPLHQGDGGSHHTNFLTGGTGGADGQTDLDIHHNYFANSNHRNPMLKNKSSRVISNLFYNWGAHATQTMGGISLDAISNFYKNGPNAQAAPYDHEFHIDVDCGGGTSCATGSPSLYIVNNAGPNNATPSNDNWASMVREVATENGPAIGTLATDYKRTSALASVGVPITVTDAAQLESEILPAVGSYRRLACDGTWVSARDAADTRVVADFAAGTGGQPTDETAVGGYPSIAAGTPCADADKDGMPDSWETAEGLNPNSAADAWLVADGQVYPNLERFLNGP